MNWVSLVIIVIVALLTWRAFRQGFLRELVGLAALILAVPVAGVFYDDMVPKVEPIIDNALASALVSFAAIFLGVIVAGQLLGYLLRRHELAADDIVEVWRTRPYCHCAFTSSPGLSDETSERFTELLVAMDPDDPDIAEMMRMEHLTKWVRATDDGWTDLMSAVQKADLVGKIF